MSIVNADLHPSFFSVNKELNTTASFKPNEGMIRSYEMTKVENSYPEIGMYENNKHKDTYAHEVLGNIQEVSLFSKLFFSKENVSEIQRLIRYYIYIYSDKEYVIGDQNETELLIIMRSQYLQYSNIPKNPNSFKKEIERLNKLVLVDLIPKLLSSIEQYIGYIRDSTTTYTPMGRGTNPSKKGEKSLRTTMDVLLGDDVFYGSSS